MKSKQITKKQFDLAIKAVSNGVYHSAYPDFVDKLQELAVEDIKYLDKADKNRYMNLRELGKDLYHTYPKDTSVDKIIMDYVDIIFEYIKGVENEEGI